MHDLRARNRSKYLVSALLTPRQQCEAALKLIKPPSNLDAKCKAEVMVCIKAIRDGKVTENQWREAQRQKPVRDLIDTLRVVEVAGAGLLSRSLLGMVKVERELLKRHLTRLSAQPRHGGTYRNAVMEKTTRRAWVFLEMYGRKLPTLTRGGPWHQLTAALFGDTVSFDYLRHAYHRVRKARSSLGPNAIDRARKILSVPYPAPKNRIGRSNRD